MHSEEQPLFHRKVRACQGKKLSVTILGVGEFGNEESVSLLQPLLPEIVCSGGTDRLRRQAVRTDIPFWADQSLLGKAVCNFIGILFYSQGILSLQILISTERDGKQEPHKR